MNFKLNQVVLYQNEDGVFIGKIDKINTVEEIKEITQKLFLTKDVIDITHLFNEDSLIETLILEEPKE